MYDVIEFFGDSLKEYCIICKCEDTGRLFLEETSDDRDVLNRFSNLLNETQHFSSGYNWSYFVTPSSVVNLL